MAKTLFVSSEIQAVLLKEILIPAMIDGFWKSHRPVGHGAQWSDVDILVSEDDFLGAVDFVPPRLYNFINPEFMLENSELLLNTAQKIKQSINIRSIKKELSELSQIVGGRIKSKSAEPTKLFRGNIKKVSAKVVAGSAKPDLTANLRKVSVVKPTNVIANSWISPISANE